MTPLAHLITFFFTSTTPSSFVSRNMLCDAKRCLSFVLVVGIMGQYETFLKWELEHHHMSVETNAPDAGRPAVAAPQLFLRVKRARWDDVGAGPQVTIRCHDVNALGAGNATGGPHNSDGIVTKRYTFLRVNNTEHDQQASSLGDSNTLQQDDAATSSANTTNTTTASTTATTSATLQQQLEDLILDDKSPKHQGVKVIARDVAARQRDRMRGQAVSLRASLRCARVGSSRNGTICIEAALETGDHQQHSSGGGDEVYDLYQLQFMEDDVEGGEGVEGDDDMGIEFDDAVDEFSFERKADAEYAQDRRQRRRLHEADVWEMWNMPRRNEWVLYEGNIQELDPTQPMLVAVPADDLEGIDNYVYYDHRNDDEYDSNAEDRPANEYPEESDSDRTEHDGDDEDYDAYEDDERHYSGRGGGYRPRHDDEEEDW